MAALPPQRNVGKSRRYVTTGEERGKRGLRVGSERPPPSPRHVANCPSSPPPRGGRSEREALRVGVTAPLGARAWQSAPCPASPHPGPSGRPSPSRGG